MFARDDRMRVSVRASLPHTNIRNSSRRRRCHRPTQQLCTVFSGLAVWPVCWYLTSPRNTDLARIIDTRTRVHTHCAVCQLMWVMSVMPWRRGWLNNSALPELREMYFLRDPYSLCKIILQIHFVVFLRWNVSGGLRKFFLFLQDRGFGRSKSPKVIDFGPNRNRVCDFLLVRHICNLGPIKYSW